MSEMCFLRLILITSFKKKLLELVVCLFQGVRYSSVHELLSAFFVFDLMKVSCISVIYVGFVFLQFKKKMSFISCFLYWLILVGLFIACSSYVLQYSQVTVGFMAGVISFLSLWHACSPCGMHAHLVAVL